MVLISTLLNIPGIFVICLFCKNHDGIRVRKEVKGNGDKNVRSEEVRRQDVGKERKIKDK